MKSRDAMWRVSWLAPSAHLKADWSRIFPLIGAQFLYHIFHIIDFRYLSALGTEALKIHSSQFSFVMLGQAIGIAGATSSLVFWRRKECVVSQGSVFLKHLTLSFVTPAIVAIPILLFANAILSHFQIPENYQHMAKDYLFIGVLNMLLFSLYGALDGMLVATNNQKLSLKLVVFLIVFNWMADFIAVSWIPHASSLTYLSYSLYCIGLSSTFILTLISMVAFGAIWKTIHRWEGIRFKEIFPVWGAECGLGFVRAGTPMIFFFQLASISSSTLLVTHQMCLNIGFLFFIPVLSGMRIAILDASREVSYHEFRNVPLWWKPFLYTALIPSVLLMIIGIFGSTQMLELFFSYTTPKEHLFYISVFFFGCILDVFSDVFIIPLRARKKNVLIARNLICSQIFLLTGIQGLIYFNMATPDSVCKYFVLYAAFQLGLNALTWVKVHVQEGGQVFFPQLRYFKFGY